MLRTEKLFTDTELRKLMGSKNKRKFITELIERDVILRNMEFEDNSFSFDGLLSSLITVQKKLNAYKGIYDINLTYLQDDYSEIRGQHGHN